MSFRRKVKRLINRVKRKVSGVKKRPTAHKAPRLQKRPTRVVTKPGVTIRKPKPASSSSTRTLTLTKTTQSVKHVRTRTIPDRSTPYIHRKKNRPGRTLFKRKTIQ